MPDLVRRAYQLARCHKGYRGLCTMFCTGACDSLDTKSNQAIGGHDVIAVAAIRSVRGIQDTDIIVR